MTEPVLSFYDALADHYHLIFEDWDTSIARQAKILSAVLASETSASPLHILDCACGIGTQALGFAQLGHRVTASDLSPAAVARARHEAALRNLSIDFHVADMTSLAEIPNASFDVVATLDNALPHLDPDQLQSAARAIASKLKPGGLFLASIRDYDALADRRPSMQEPLFFGEEGQRRIVHQVWDWIDGKRYILHLYISIHHSGAWSTHHFISEYRPLLRKELSLALSTAGFNTVQWLMPAQTGYYQPIVLARL